MLILFFYPHVCSFSALAVRWRASAALSFWAVRRRSPACHNYYRFVFRLTGYSGARPRLHRLQACRARRAVAAAGAGVRKLPAFPGCQNRRQPFRRLRRCVSFHAVRLWAACPAVFFVAAAASCSLGGVLPATVAAGIRKGRFTCAVLMRAVWACSPAGYAGEIAGG